MTTRKEVPVRNHAGIYKLHKLDESTGKWIDTGKYRAVRRVREDGSSRKEQAVFTNLEDAKAFRLGERQVTLPTGDRPKPIHEERYTFRALVDEWRQFHYLKLELSTQQMYDARLPNLEVLHRYDVREITMGLMDEVVRYWVKEFPKIRGRESFEKELDLLKTILNFYRTRKNPAYVMPILRDHYEAGDISKKAERPVESLSKEDLSRFLEALGKEHRGRFYPLALAQFCLGLRIGEACGLHWGAIDLETRMVRIEWTVAWNQNTWESRIKRRPKNGKVRFLVIPEALVPELEKLKATRQANVPLVFHDKGKPFNRRLIGQAYNRTLQRLGITHVSGTHMLRKTSATLANEITGDFYAVSKLMDHSNPNITLRYVSQTTTQKQKVADALNSVLSSSAGPQPVPQCPTRVGRPSLTLIKSDN